MSHTSSLPPVISLWPEGAPGALGTSPNDIPTLTAYLPAPEKRNGASMLVLPGGGYGGLASHEGKDFAGWLASHGITCYVLQYRLGSHGYHHPCMLNDAARGLRVVRAFARRDGLDPARIGIIGSSAGGHLASTLLTHFDAGQPGSSDPIEHESSRPDLGILCYPVISGVTFPHQGSFINLLGENPPADLVRHLSNELHVTAQTPPTFIWHTAADPTVPVENAFLFASALRAAGVPFDLHVYEKGGHGLGLPSTNKNAPPWDADCLYWLRQRGFLTPM
ncbi:MAG: endo,4-beta-xylanase [Rariglobus sp.]|jgi:acetyl esterase/lipase|nr:endo,4-beta-xylanase [Rariglobus sp.]